MYESHKMWVSFGTVKVWEDFVNKKMNHLIFSIRKEASMCKVHVCNLIMKALFQVSLELVFACLFCDLYRVCKLYTKDLICT